MINGCKSWQATVRMWLCNVESVNVKKKPRCGLFLDKRRKCNALVQWVKCILSFIHVLNTLPETMNTTLRRRIPRSYTRLLYITNNTLLESPAAPSLQRVTTPRQNPPHPPTQPQTQNEAHEGTTPLNAPLNPPGGGPGGNILGSGGGGAFSFKFTQSPILDAILTTALGIGAGKLLHNTLVSSCSSTLVFIGGVAYVKWYKINVLNKVLR